MTIDDLHKSFGPERVLRGISLKMTAAEHLAVLGASGSGKTTLLRILAGLEHPDSGRITLDGADITAAPPEQRGVVYMPQDALLFPHLTAAENVAFPLRVRGIPANEAVDRTSGLRKRLGLDAHAGKYPDALSGGQRQRVAFGRALTASPRVLLLDEPFGALDHEARADMQGLFLDVIRTETLTTVFVTHDPGEALRLGTRWGLLENGHLELFPTREAFAASDRTGIPQERAFWASV